MTAYRMLMEKIHPEETRAVILQGKTLENFESETLDCREEKGNIYVAEIMQVVPSLQAAFVRYRQDAEDKYGFLPFGDIHPRYYILGSKAGGAEDAPPGGGSCPQTLGEEEKNSTADKSAEALAPHTDKTEASLGPNILHDEGEWEAPPLMVPEAQDEGKEGEDTLPTPDASSAPSSAGKKPKYRIQDVIKPRQSVVIQVVKDVRGQKGAAVTTYISLPGRYCVFMPHMPDQITVSKKITASTERKKIKTTLQSLTRPKNALFIVRTAGAGRTKSEFKRDIEYLTRLWRDIEEKIHTSKPPTLVYKETQFIGRILRDYYHRNMTEILVDGPEAYQEARHFLKMFIPSHGKKVKLYEKPGALFADHDIDTALEAIHHPKVTLKSGGSLVIETTEALTSVDVNSGKSTRERHIQDTALKTNLEAAEEVARHLRLRDLGGLIIIDFIDMEQKKHRTLVEQRLKMFCQSDRSKIQLGHINEFGLLCLSRQRLRPSLQENYTTVCAHCQGAGVIRSLSSAALNILRLLSGYQMYEFVHLALPTQVGLYLLNHKRTALQHYENTHKVFFHISLDDSLGMMEHKVLETREKPQNTSPVKAMNAVKPKPKTAAKNKTAAKTKVKETTQDQTKTSKSQMAQSKKPGDLPAGDAVPQGDAENFSPEKKKSKRKRTVSPQPATTLHQSLPLPSEGLSSKRKRKVRIVSHEENTSEEGASVSRQEASSDVVPKRKRKVRIVSHDKE